MIKYHFQSPVHVGLDPSTYTGLVALQDGVVKFQSTLNIKDVKGFDRAHLLAAKLRGYLGALKSLGNPTVYMEGFAYGNRFSLVHMVEVSTAFKFVMNDLGIDWYTVQPSHLKKWTTGNGKAKKDQMARAVKDRWKFVPTKEKGIKTDDVVDAFALAQMRQASWVHPVVPTPTFRG